MAALVLHKHYFLEAYLIKAFTFKYHVANAYRGWSRQITPRSRLI